MNSNELVHMLSHRGEVALLEAALARLEHDDELGRMILADDRAAELSSTLAALDGEDEQDRAAFTLSMLALWLMQNGELRAGAKVRSTARSGLGARFDAIDACTRDERARESGAHFTRFADPRDGRAARHVRPASPSSGARPQRRFAIGS